MRIQLKSFFLILAVVLLITTSSCSFLGLGSKEADKSDSDVESDGDSDKTKDKEKKDKDEEDEEDVGLGSDYSEIELFFEGLRSYDGERYSLAKSMFAKLISKFPASPLVVVAELKMADSLFYGQKYPEAIGAYRDFNSLHSTHEAKSYALYQIGRSYQLAYQGAKQDETPIKEAIKAYLDLINQFPDSYFSLQAKTSILECDKILLNSEKDVIDFYLKTNKPEAAKARLIYAKANYGHIPEIDSILDYEELEITNDDKPDSDKDLVEPKKTDAKQEGEELASLKISSDEKKPEEVGQVEDHRELETLSIASSNKENADSLVKTKDEKISSLLVEEKPSEAPKMPEPVPTAKNEIKNIGTESNVVEAPPALTKISTPTNSVEKDHQVNPILTKEEKFTEELLKAEALVKSKIDPASDVKILPNASPTAKPDILSINPIDNPRSEKNSGAVKNPETAAIGQTMESVEVDKFEKMKRLASGIPSANNSIGNLGSAEFNQNKMNNSIDHPKQTKTSKTLGSLEALEKVPNFDKKVEDSETDNRDSISTPQQQAPANSIPNEINDSQAASIFLNKVECKNSDDGTLITLNLKTPPIIRSSKNYKQNGAFGENTFQIRLVLQNQLSIVPQASEQDTDDQDANWTVTKSSSCPNATDKIKIFEKTRKTIDPSGFEPSATVTLLIDSPAERKLGISYSQNREKINISVK